MPTIRDVVSALNQRDGVDAVLVTGRDGLPIDSATGPDVDPDTVAALVPSVVDASNKVGDAGRRGHFAMGVVEYNGGFLIVSTLTPESLLAVLVRTGANVGHLLYELRRYRSAIAELL